MCARRSVRGVACAAALAALLAVASFQASAQRTEATATVQSILQGAEKIGAGRIAAYRKNGSLLLAIPEGVFQKPFVWYAEAVGLPAGVVSEVLEAGSLLARFEPQGDLVLVRDLTTRASRSGGDAGSPIAGEDAPGEPIPGAPELTDSKERPIDIALNLIETGPVIAAFPVVARSDDGTAVVDVTGIFAADVASLTARGFVALSGLVPAALDPRTSYIERVRMSEGNLNIRSHLTFLAADPRNPATGVRPVSIVIGHSFVFLPEKPMAWRQADPRIGFISAKFTEYEPNSGETVFSRDIITRFRLEKKNPDAAVSDPVKPIVFYIGPGVPDRWRAYVKAGVELWRPAFEAAGFSNAIVAVDAPSAQQDPDWSVEDVGRNVIRWVATERVNAYGPHVIDPRSGEVLSAHILIWPSVLDYFSKYYYAIYGTVDPAAAKLPLPESRRGELLTYIVAHEVGHTLGLRHNHIASTAYSVEQMRDAVFANAHGANSSIMAYGRFNQVAQPGDGLTRFFPPLGPYDMAAIAWGYGQFGKTPAEEREALAAMAESFGRDRALHWAAGELPAEMSRSFHDPRVLKENTGAERIDATRLGAANILRSLAQLDAATGGDDELYAGAYAVLLGTHKNLLQSVTTLVGGAMPRVGGAGPRIELVPASDQADAIDYLLGEGVRSLEAYRDPAIAGRVAVVGGARAIEGMQAGMVADLLAGSRIALLESQAADDPAAYTPARLGHDVATAIWDNLESTSPTERTLQRAYIAQTRRLLEQWPRAGEIEAADTRAAAAAGFALGFAAIESDTGDDTAYPGWLRIYLPQLQLRLDIAARQAEAEVDRSYFAATSVQIGRLIELQH